MKIIRFALSLALAGIFYCAQAQNVNPATQIQWPRVTGSGAPTATCPSATNTPTTATVGTPYTDTSANRDYTCGSSGWYQASGGASGSAGGDLSGTYPNPTVVRVNGAVVPSSTPFIATNSSRQIVPAAYTPVNEAGDNAMTGSFTTTGPTGVGFSSVNTSVISPGPAATAIGIGGLAPNMATGGSLISMGFGKEGSAGNVGTFNFYFDNFGSVNNHAGIGLYGTDDLFQVYTNKTVSTQPLFQGASPVVIEGGTLSNANAVAGAAAGSGATTGLAGTDAAQGLSVFAGTGTTTGTLVTVTLTASRGHIAYCTLTPTSPNAATDFANYVMIPVSNTQYLISFPTTPPQVSGSYSWTVSCP